MLPCLNKKLFGLDCLGCGFQRSLLHVIKGDFVAAFNIYPAIYTLVLMAIFFILNLKFKFKSGKKIIIIFAIINVLIIITSYFIKMKPIFTT
ncbi:hypothetical protein BST83_05685 [Polaribacter filamentus]|uniref:DUF2752 domain-containing protein n=1 Tax=Polaribacter filamentus TaxID=53483 RepID=A0A2S7L158_9FLAO|nr:DUF2752 domain-containing protein [Polaribacter filamentus]PQB08621.1 hypothetical protein BST83_05685 [Polaribacter filamentus]